MRNRKLILFGVFAQILICFWILLKVLFLPYLVWRVLGTSTLASRFGDLSVLALGTGAILSMGYVGYRHAEHFPSRRSKIRVALQSMTFIHIPLFLFLFYKSIAGSAWDTYWSMYLSGWLSIVAHPMILVGFYGKWVDFYAALLLCSSYLAGVWIYFDETGSNKLTRIRGNR
jgi:hypothetical protein